jgi:hypothetical protein
MRSPARYRDPSDRSTGHINKDLALAKTTIVQLLMDFVYEKPIQQWEKRLSHLVERHNSLTGQTCTGILFRGDIYLSQAHAGRYFPLFKPLHSSLYPEMVKLVQEKEALMAEKESARTFFVIVVNATPHPQHYRDLLPECLHAALPPIPLGKEPLPLPTETIEQIHHQCADAILTIKRRLTMNLIL